MKSNKIEKFKMKPGQPMSKSLMRKIVKETFERNDNAIQDLVGIEVLWSDVRIIDKKLRKFKFDPGHLRKTFENEHGYKYPIPIILKGKLELDLLTDSLKHFYNPRVIIALMRDIAFEAAKRNIDISCKNTHNKSWWEFFGKKYVTLKLIDSFKYDLDRDIEEDYLYSWHNVGGYHGESCTAVGLALCNLLVCFKTRDIALVCWERETTLMKKEFLQRWFNEIIAYFNESSLDMNDAILQYMRKAQDLCDKVECAAKDKNIHLYQDPNMETFWIERGDIRKARKLIEKNKHPGSHKNLLLTLDSKAVEEAIVKNVVNHIINMDKIMINWHLTDGPQRKLTPVSQLLVLRWEQAEREGDEEEKQVLLNLAKGLIREMLLEKLNALDVKSPDYFCLAEYIDIRIGKDIEIFLKNIGKS